MYNQFGNPYIVYHMHQAWIKSQMGKRQLSRHRSVARHLVNQIAQMILKIGQQLTIWGEALQQNAQPQSNQPV